MRVHPDHPDQLQLILFNALPDLLGEVGLIDVPQAELPNKSHNNLSSLQ